MIGENKMDQEVKAILLEIELTKAPVNFVNTVMENIQAESIIKDAPLLTKKGWLLISGFLVALAFGLWKVNSNLIPNSLIQLKEQLPFSSMFQIDLSFNIKLSVLLFLVAFGTQLVIISYSRRDIL